MTTEMIDKDTARAAVRKAAFTVDDPDLSDHGRTIVHVFLGFIGADWDLNAVLDLIDNAERVAWTDNLFGHDLAVLADGRVHSLDVRRPAPDGAS